MELVYGAAYTLTHLKLLQRSQKPTYLNFKQDKQLQKRMLN